jgi:hypothetical protein
MNVRTRIPASLRLQLLLRYWRIVCALVVIAGLLAVVHFSGLLVWSDARVVGRLESASVGASSEHRFPVVFLHVRLVDGEVVSVTMPHSAVVRIGQPVELRVLRRMLMDGSAYEFIRYVEASATAMPEPRFREMR